MRDAIYGLVERKATWELTLLLVALFLLCVAIFECRRSIVGETFESVYVYTPAEANKILDKMGDSGRHTYALTEITLDLVFPFVYGSLFAILLFYLYSKGIARWLMLIPLVTVVADLLENFTAAYLAWSFVKDQTSPLALAATTFTIVKTVLYVLTVVLILAGAVWMLIRLAGRRRKGA